MSSSDEGTGVKPYPSDNALNKGRQSVFKRQRKHLRRCLQSSCKARANNIVICGLDGGKLPDITIGGGGMTAAQANALSGVLLLAMDVTMGQKLRGRRRYWVPAEDHAGGKRRAARCAWGAGAELHAAELHGMRSQLGCGHMLG